MGQPLDLKQKTQSRSSRSSVARLKASHSKEQRRAAKSSGIGPTLYTVPVTMKGKSSEYERRRVAAT